MSKRHHQLYSKLEVIQEQKSHPNGLQRLSKYVLTTSVCNTDFLTALPVTAHTIISRFQDQNLLSRFTLHLLDLRDFINIPGTSFIGTGRGTSMSVEHNRCIQFGLTNLFPMSFSLLGLLTALQSQRSTMGIEEKYSK